MEKYDLDAIVKTGIPTLDKQHRELFKRVNMLIDAFSGDENPKDFGEMIAFLESYVAVHLSTEEDLMLIHNYPEFGAHKNSHEIFRKKIIEFRQKFDAEGASLELATMIKDTIGDWFLNHIKVIDMKYAPFLKGKTE